MNELNKQFYNFETSLLKPEVRSSREKLDAFLADDFLEFGSSGLVYRKADVLERLPANTDKVVYEVSDFEARELAENLVFTTFKTRRTINDADVIVSFRSSIWRRTDGVWQMFFCQGTPTKA